MPRCVCCIAKGCFYPWRLQSPAFADSLLNSCTVEVLFNRLTHDVLMSPPLSGPQRRQAYVRFAIQFQSEGNRLLRFAGPSSGRLNSLLGLRFPCVRFWGCHNRHSSLIVLYGFLRKYVSKTLRLQQASTTRPEKMTIEALTSSHVVPSKHLSFPLRFVRRSLP